MDDKTAETNIRLNEKLEDQTVYSQMSSATETEDANLKLQEAMNNRETNQNMAPTYLYNETPAIKISGDDE
jgi:cell shape-determining protein MreC